MKRHLLWLALGILLCLPASARERLSGWCEQGNNTVTVGGLSSTESVQQSFPACTVTVFDEGTANLSSIFSDNAGTPLANPFTADATGFWFFYANNARYDVRLSGGGLAAPFTMGDFLLSDAFQGTQEAVTFSATPTFDAASADIFTITLTGNVTSSTISNPATGKIITIVVTQDGTGGRTFAWPADVILRTATFVVSDDANAVSSLTAYYNGTNWQETSRTADEVGRDLVPVATGRNAGSSLALWDAFLRAGIWADVHIVGGDTYPATAAGVQAAIDAAEAAGGGIVFLPSQTTIALGTTELTLCAGNTDNVHLVGAGRSTTTITYDDTAVAISIGDVTNSGNRCSVRDFTLSKSGAARETGSVGIKVFGGQSHRYINVQVSLFEIGIVLDGDGGDVAMVEVPMNSVRLSQNLIGIDMTGVITTVYSTKLHIVGPGQATSGGFGIRQENNVGQGGYFVQTSMEQLETGIQQGGNLWHYDGLRRELITNALTWAGSAADANTFMGVHDVNVTTPFAAPPSGANANMIQIAGKYNFLTDGATNTSVMTFFDGATSKLNFVYDPTLNRFKFDSVGGGDILTIDQGTERVLLGTNFSTSGILNFPNNQFLAARNAANTTNFNLIGFNASDLVELSAAGVGTFANDWIRTLTNIRIRDGGSFDIILGGEGGGPAANINVDFPDLTGIVEVYTTGTDAALDLADIVTATCTTERTVAVSGAAFGDVVEVTAGTDLEAGTFLAGHVSSAGNTQWQFCNLSGGNVNRGVDTYTIRVVR